VTATTPVERVADMLAGAGFERVSVPVRIAGLAVDMPAAFVGLQPSPDLVLIGDTTRQTARQLQQAIEGVGRALDSVRSRRPLTLVIAGPRPESAVLGALSRYARVLPVGEIADQASLENWLAVLLPLNLPETGVVRGGAASLDALRAVADPLALDLIDQAELGETAVAERFHALVEASFEDIEDDDLAEEGP
jgi:hypothetical protein